MVAESKRRKVFLYTGWSKTEESSGFFVSQVEKGSTGQGRAGQGRRLGPRGRGSYFTLRTEAPRQLCLLGGLHVYRRRKLTNKSLLCVPQLYVVWSKYPHVCMDRKYNGILSLTLSSNSK